MWKIVITPVKEFRNCEFIFPTHQRAVNKLVNVWSKDFNIKKITIFGSAVTNGCNPWSDLDVYIEKSEDKPVPTHGIIDTFIDRWDNYSVDEDLFKEITEKGVVVYER